MISDAVEERSRLVVQNGSVPYINHSGLDDVVISESADIREIAEKLSRWVDNARNAAGRSTMFDRGAFSPPDNPYEEMRAARTAVERDDVVASVAEITEAFAFSGVKWESESADDADVFNQLSADWNLDDVLRMMWRETFGQSQYVAAMVWGWREYTVRGRTPDKKIMETITDQVTGDKVVRPVIDEETGKPKVEKGQRRKRKYRVWAPVTIRIIDGTKVVPVGHGPLGGGLLAWQSGNDEVDLWTKARTGEIIDPLMAQFFLGLYTPDEEEKAELVKLGVDTNSLLLMNPGMVFRHTTTKPSYKRFADVRLKSLFRLLDLKQQLINADRSLLIGAANYILLIRKGDKDFPAQQEEVENLKENYRFIAKLPVIISDHRLQIDIVAPKTDFALQAEKYEVIDLRILSRLLGTLSIGGRGQRNETNVTLSRAVARSMENLRHMMKRTIEREIAKAVVEHPKNQDVFEATPNMVFNPRNIALNIDASLLQAVMALRDKREISRETILEYFGLDQEMEAMRRELEAEQFDDIFQTHVPFDSPMGDPHKTGSQGGRPLIQVKPESPTGNPSTPPENSA